MKPSPLHSSSQTADPDSQSPARPMRLSAPHNDGNRSGAETYHVHATTVEAAAPTGSPLTPPDLGPSHNGRPDGVLTPAEKLALELKQFEKVARELRGNLAPAAAFRERCQQAFDVANDLFAHAPTWVCFYREVMGIHGILRTLFKSSADFGAFLRTEQHHQLQLMLTALRGREQPENDPNDPQRMITVRLPKSLHESMVEEARQLNISVNRLCISRMLQLLDPEMIPEISSKPRGRKPRASGDAPLSVETNGEARP